MICKRKGGLIMIAVKSIFTVIIAVLSLAISTSHAVTYSNHILNLSEEADPKMLYNHDNARVEVSGTTVHVVWLGELRDASKGCVLFYKRSLDGGKTFNAPIVLDSNPPRLWGQINFDPWDKLFAVDSPYVHILYKAGDPYCLKYLRSSNNGATFDSARVLTSTTTDYSGVYMTAGGGKVDIAWAINNTATGVRSITCAYSTNSGTSFNFTQVAYSDNNNRGTVDGMGINGFAVADIIRSGNNLYILGSTSVDDGTYDPPSYLFLYSSINGGANFKMPLRVNIKADSVKSKAPRIHDIVYTPNLAALGDTVHVAWVNIDDPGAMAYSLRVRTSVDAGSTFREPVTLYTYTPGYHSGSVHGQESIVRHGGSIFVVTVMNEFVSGTYVWRSTDNGASFTSAKKISGGGWWPHIAVDKVTSNRVHVTNGWYFLSTDGGTNFNGGVNPHLNIKEWRKPQMAIGRDGAIHYVGSCGSGPNPNDQEIHYRRIAAANEPATADSCLSLVATSDRLRYDHIQIAATPAISFTNAMTAELWIKRNSDDYNYYKSFLRKSHPGITGSYELGAWDDFQIYGRIVTDSSGSFWMGSATTLPSNTWTHIAMTYDRTGTNNFRIYVNGMLTAFSTVKGQILTSIADSPLKIGPDEGNSAGACFIDEVRLWNKARTQAEIIADMGKPLSGTEPGLVAYYNFNSSYKDITGNGYDAFPMFMESFAPVGSKQPYVISTTPANGDSGVLSSTNLSITFNENINKGSGAIIIWHCPDINYPHVIYAFDTIQVASASVTVDNAVVNLKSSKNFITEQTYCITMPAGCFTNANNVAFQGIQSPMAWRFKIGTTGVRLSEAFCAQTERLTIGLKRNIITIHSVNSKKTLVSLKLFTLNGQIVWQEENVAISAGLQTVVFPVYLKSGIYQCEVQQNQKMAAKKLVRRICVVR